MKLEPEQFKSLLRNGILVSLELLVLNGRGEVLLGRRKNAPAKGYLFVPGGRIYKGETPQAALKRIAHAETGLDLQPEDAAFHGIYQHVYPENCFAEPELGGTEYLAIACLFRLPGEPAVKHDSQHEELRFVAVETMLSAPDVHEYTKSYFQQQPSNAFVVASSPSVSEKLKSAGSI